VLGLVSKLADRRVCATVMAASENGRLHLPDGKIRAPG